MIKKPLVAGALALAASPLLASTAHAAEPPTPSRAYLVSDGSGCYAGPGADHDLSSTNLPSGTLIPAAAKSVTGRMIGGGSTVWVYLKPSSSPRGCWVLDSWITRVDGNLDPKTFRSQMLVHTGGTTAAYGLDLFAAPTTSAQHVGQVEDGDVIVTRGTPIKGTLLMDGSREQWMPVSRAGVLAFMKTSELVSIPRPSSYERSLTLPRAVTLLGAPTSNSEEIDTLAEGSTVQTGEALDGYLPVKAGEQTGWISAAEVIPDPEPESKSVPDAESRHEASPADSLFPKQRLGIAGTCLTLLGIGAAALRRQN